MPLYEYQCLQCGKSFELLQKMGTTAEQTQCPYCGAGEVKARFSTFAAQSGTTGTSGGATTPST